MAVTGCSSGDENVPPIVNIDGPSEILENSDVVATSTVNDADGSVVKYLWEQTSGPSVSITDNNRPTLEFKAPEVDDDQAITLRLKVTDNDDAHTYSAELTIIVKQSLADANPVTNILVVEDDTEASVFISALNIGVNKNLLHRVSFIVKPRDGALADPFRVTYPIDAVPETISGIRLPIFGLYSDHANSVELEFEFIDYSSSSRSVTIYTEEDSTASSLSLEVLFPADSDHAPSFSFFHIKSFLGPIILDIDGYVRWAPNEVFAAQSQILNDDSFQVFLEGQFHKLNLSGNVWTTDIRADDLSNIRAHHNVDKGKLGYLVEIDADKAQRPERIYESILLEIDNNGNTINEWDFGVIFSEYMLSQGDDPSNFVRDGSDWCHMNSAIYDPSDNTIVMSCRENFVVKVGYQSKDIFWLLGDETKHWFVNYPSLQALSLSSQDVKPMGQHSLSLVNEELMLFNNGQLSFQAPDGVPLGGTLPSALVSRYAIDQERNEANVTWSYDAGLVSDICSSIYKDEGTSDGDYLITYASLDRAESTSLEEPIQSKIQVIDEDQQLKLELKMVNFGHPCSASWNSVPLPQLSDLQVNQTP
jgi:tRNA threonylcarbamoyladenosine modification (KEOPS) complex  Pcc1 subunit